MCVCMYVCMYVLRMVTVNGIKNVILHSYKSSLSRVIDQSL